MVEFTPEKSKKIALARLDLLNQWKEFRKKSDNKLIPQYRYAKVDEYRTCLTDEEIKIFMGLLLHPIDFA